MSFGIDFDLFMKMSGLTIKQISDKFSIPYRTVQNWSNGSRKCPEYIIKMMIRINNLEYEISTGGEPYYMREPSNYPAPWERAGMSEKDFF